MPIVISEGRENEFGNSKPGTGEPGGLPSMRSQSRTQLKRLSSSSSKAYDKICNRIL